jgi:serine/threonine protein kinase
VNADETLVASSPPSTRAPEASYPAEIGRYSVVGELGRGGMGVVLLARDPALDRDVAIKLLRASAERQAELLVEAQTMARLSHPNVLAVYDAGTVDGRTFVAMERVRGGTLRQWLARRARHPGEILDAFDQAGEGLAAAHRAGLVHRDVKPDNMLVGDDGRVRVSDFGLALSADIAEPGNKASSSPGSSVAGTPAYMAPEQIEGAPTDARADQCTGASTVEPTVRRTIRSGIATAGIATARSANVATRSPGRRSAGSSSATDRATQ